MKTLPAWSFSRYRKWNDCPRAAKHSYIDKLPDPPGPAMKRGSDIHKACEDYLNAPQDHPIPCPPEALGFRGEMESLRTETGLRVEEQWSFDKDWNEVSWFDKRAFFRAKVDVRFGRRDGGILTIIDFKTGSAKRAPGPEVKDQIEVYALAAFKKFGDAVKEVHVHFWYFDRPPADNTRSRIFKSEFDRDDLVEKWGKIAKDLTTDEIFVKRPGKHCFWCAFHKKKNGPCDGRVDGERSIDDGGF